MSTLTWEEPVDPFAPEPGVRAAAPTSGGLPGGRVRQVTEFIEENLDKDLPLAELAAVVCMSPFHFARLFKRSTGVPPHRFVVRQRIARARLVLTTRELSIAQISRMVGFRTPSHFTTVFRRVLGMTPRAFRETVTREDRRSGEGECDG
jgi:AraC family transcriptional regulator